MPKKPLLDAPMALFTPFFSQNDAGEFSLLQRLLLLSVESTGCVAGLNQGGPRYDNEPRPPHLAGFRVARTSSDRSAEVFRSSGHGGFCQFCGKPVGVKTA